ncbi:unnamed protein product, partial [Heterosigma akashiwo]
LCAVGAFFNLCWIFALQFWKEKKIIKMSQPLLCKLFAGGCAALCLTNITVLGAHNTALCMLRPWALHIPMTFAFACLFAKVWRVHKILGNAKLKKMKIATSKLMRIVGMILGFELIILTLETAIDPQKAVAETVVETLYEYTSYSCKSSGAGSYFTALIWTFEGAMLIYGCYLAFVTRNYDRHLAEGQYIALAIYNMVLLAAVAALM